MAHGANVEDIAYFYPRDAMLARVKSDRNVSVGPSVRHEPVLCQNEES